MADESKASSDGSDTAGPAVAMQGGQPAVVVKHSSGAQATAYLHGATVTSWLTADGTERLFLSSKAVFDGATPIRGGIPLVFPQFGGGELPSHGFARRSTWTVADLGDGTARLVLTPTPAIRDMWPHEFALALTIELEDSKLTTTLSIKNDGATDFKFQALQHTYLRTADVTQVEVAGLQGLTYIDKLKGGAEFKEEGERLKIAAETDRIYRDLPGPAVIARNLLAAREQVVVEAGATLDATAAASDVVVWNPWVDKAKRMDDFGDDEYPGMLCIEPGRVSTWETLPPGSAWSLKQCLTVVAPAARDPAPSAI